MQVLSKNEALETVAANVEALILERGWSARELARRSQNSAMRVSRLLNRENMPAADALARIAECLGGSIDSLFQSC
jgi:transcriptional regulator with XRE-family HTH domain